MQVVETSRELRARADACRAAGLRVALVPTMGALHAGHLALVAEAKRRAAQVLVSIFVNPTQFDARADLEAYPRPLERDLVACREAGVDAVFVPCEADLYPEGAQTFVEVRELSAPLCGASRPGHFRGVATVVTRLLITARPHVAVFGRKDYQQLLVVRRLVRDLGLDVEVVGVPTVREPDGLALSSRNVHLGPEARRQAGAIFRALEGAEAAVRAGERSAEAILSRARSELAKAPLARLDYAELRCPETLAPAPARLRGPTLLALAVFFPRADGEAVRLIDHRVLDARPPFADAHGPARE